MNRTARKTVAGLAALALGMVGMATIASPAKASSHSDAPLIKLDPQANLTDVYAYVRNRVVNGQTTKVLNILINVRPFSNSGDGVTYEKFSDDARYSIHITNPNTGETLIRYDFMFSGPSAGLKNPNTVLSYGLGTSAGPISDTNLTDPHRNYTQTYNVFKTVFTNGVPGSPVQIASNVPTPPPNVGKNTTPFYNDASGAAVSGATSRAALDIYTRDAIQDLPTGETIFAGTRDDSFFSDIPGIFDLLDSRLLSNVNGNGLGQDGTGPDDFKGFNVLNYSIQIPISQLPAMQYTPVFAGFGGLGGATTGVGVYASVSRPRITLRSSTGPTSSGPWVQVNRLANPIFNEALVALADKDNYNFDSPTNDAAKYAKYADNPEIAALINAIYGTSFVTTGRADLHAVYIPDVVRVDTTTDPVPVPGVEGFNRLSFIGGDVVNGANGLRPGGWPNGRRQGDDVVDIALTAIASGPSYSTVTLLGDNVDHNDMTYNTVFPYLATPHSGYKHSYDQNGGNF